MKKKLSKSDAIREALKVTSSPTEVAKAVNKQGIKVTVAYVSTIKSSDKKKKATSGKPQKRGRPAKEKSNSSLQEASGLMVIACDLVLKAGGTGAKQMIDAAARIVERVEGE